ncbi:MAG: hypothetical protein JXQ75_04940 [Phycisphaerae bacterium]|nr:hypothetical protein [Phycisphaerae bacterium]
MKLPNLRLYDTQATASMFLGFLGLFCLIMLALFVLYGLDTELMVIPYNPDGTKGQFRKALVFLMTAITMLVGAVAAVLGFTSLGQRRNTKQGRSWLGMTIGALVLAITPVLFFAWRELSEPLIRDLS